MPQIAPEILEACACPSCEGVLRYTKEEVLVCLQCRVCYPLENGMPYLAVEASLPLSADGRIVPRESFALFQVDEGSDAGVCCRLEVGTCKAIGRRLDDPVKTQIYNVDFTVSLDDHTKRLIRNYVTRRLGMPLWARARSSRGEYGPYRRVSDLILSDGGVSRLQAMIFHDASGVGLLDLVSRNGTFVNGKEVESCTLKDGDEIRMGRTKIRFRSKS